MNVLYYSKFCKHSEALLEILSKSNSHTNYYFVSIDKRKTVSGKTIIILDNGKEVTLPSIIERVPALLLTNHGNRVLTGGEILHYLRDADETNGNNVQTEPEPFHLNTNIQDNISSDAYSFLDMDSDSLTAKGDGGVRQMHNYVPLDNNPFISTPNDDYVADKVGAGGQNDLEKYIAEREKNIPKHKPQF
jgi:hypothetical protein|uniref:Glutaredoxin domain-containing protein n=1 Tax=viral metagenome TaxID=1070528 RepID=A0A6C0JDS4_9ZZZZ